MLITKNDLNHYKWGNLCDGWRLFNSNELSVIEECMPPGTSEVLHYHKKARQIFYILSGKGCFVIEGKEIVVIQGQSVLIEPMKAHLVTNNTNQELRFLLISHPTTQGDRYEVKA